MTNAYEILSEVCEKYRIQSLLPLFDAVRNLQNQKNFINISVLGQFKAGKSSFINSLIGKSILPVASTPLTNVITTVQFGSTEKVFIFRHHHKEETEAENLEDYISEEKNPENIKELDKAIVESPGLSRIKRIKLTDTPGLGSVFKHNSKITADWLPNTGISLILISCTQPLSENDLNLIEETIRFGPEIVIILTKTDLVDEKDIEKLRSFMVSVLSEKFDRQFPIFEYSIKDKSYREDILKNLLIPLNNNFENKNVRILNYKLKSLRNQCLNYLDIAYQSGLRKKEGELKLKEKILDEKLNNPVIRKELDLIAQSYTSGTRERLKKYLFGKFKEKLTLKTKRVFSEEYFNWRGNLNQISRTYEAWFKEFISNELNIILKSERESIDEIPAEAKNHFEQYLQFFRERLDERILKVLGLKMKTEKWEINTKEILRPDISIGWAFESQIDLLWFLIPMSIFKKVFFRYFLKQIPWEVEKNLYRLSAELTKAVNDTIINTKEEAFRYIKDELLTIEKLLSNNNTDTESVGESIRLLESLEFMENGLSE